MSEHHNFDANLKLKLRISLIHLNPFLFSHESSQMDFYNSADFYNLPDTSFLDTSNYWLELKIRKFCLLHLS